MRAAISSDLLMRLISASPEQYAAVERILGMGSGQVPPASNGTSDAAPVSADEARRLFALLRTLELDTHFRKAPVTRVFTLYCLDARSRKQVARDCKCSTALISLRLHVIEAKLGRKPAELRQYSDQFERMTDSLSDSRARHIHRPSALDAPEEDDDDLD